tara:strand:- start:11796 stop:12950 length:1155 start_codon:yes stop_codon:yes gene_type:complete
MPKLILEERVKYPPFESYRFKPELLPIAVKKTEIITNVSAKEAYERIRNMPPPFRIGSKSTWLVERRYTLDDETLKLDEKHAQEMLESAPRDSIIDRQRNGWYLTPNVVHAQARKIMNFSVTVLLVALTYLFLEPLISTWGIPSIGTGRVRFGLLDYPLLAVVVVPILFVPIMMRVTANFSDLVKQRRFLKSQPAIPKIDFHSDTTSGGELVATIQFPEAKDNWKSMSVLWRVGVLPPSRKALMEALGRKENTQPAPGLTTELPHHWTVDLDDGTGGGEDSPMQSTDVKGGLFLRPMRIMQQSEIVNVAEGKTTIPPPKGNWPGTIFSPLIRIHWEMVVIIERENLPELLWVQPLKVKHPALFCVTDAIVNSGRTETNHPLSLS